jgi:hypothetical protein
MCRPTLPDLPFAHPAVRDLAFLLTAPAPWFTDADLPVERLLGGEGWALLDRLDAVPAALERWLALHPSRRLGRYAELLLAFWFRFSPHCRLVAHGLPVRDPGGVTLGEFDFLVELDGEPWHIETCSKFYLQSRPALAGLVGPDARDTWCGKAARLTRQLALAGTPSGRAVLPAGFDACRAGAVVRGWMFYPDRPESPPPLNPARLWGWLVAAGADWPVCDDASRWLILPRGAWLAPARQVSLPGSLQSVHQALVGVDRAQLVAEMRCDGGVWQEVRRGCVLPENWPEKV